MLDPALFAEGCRLLAADSLTRGQGIGTLREKSVHRVLKYCCNPFADGQEVSIGGYVADVVGEQGVMEIQSAQFGRLRDKLAAFLPCCPVTIIWPAEADRWLCNLSPEGELLSRRRSPRHQKPQHLFEELYPIRAWLTHPGLRIRIVLLETEEYRLPRKGRKTLRCDRVPLQMLGQLALDCPADYGQLLPDTLTGRFGAKETARACGIDLNTSRMMLRILCQLGILTEDGKEGRRLMFRRTDSPSET